jgi:hypothetical protein
MQNGFGSTFWHNDVEAKENLTHVDWLDHLMVKVGFYYLVISHLLWFEF